MAMRRESNSKVGDGLRTLWIVIVVVTGIPALVPSCTPPRALGATIGDDDDARLSAAGAETVDRLLARFHETLDLAPLYDEFFVADAARRSAKTGTFADALEGIGVEPRLVDEIDDATLRRAFVAYFDLAHLGFAYVAVTVTPDSDEEDFQPLPPAVAQRAAGSKYVRLFLTDEETDGEAVPTVRTPQEFAELVDELESICADYRRVVSTSTFDSPIRARNLLELGPEADEVKVAVSDASSEYSRLGVPEGERVVEVRRDAMVWYDVRFVDGSPKLVTFEIDVD